MTLIHHNPADLFPPYRGYVHAAEVVGGARLLFISGLNGYERDGISMPESFEEQAGGPSAICSRADSTDAGRNGGGCEIVDQPGGRHAQSPCAPQAGW